MLKWSKKLNGIDFKIITEYKYVELDISNGFQPKNVNIKWNRHGQTVETKQSEGEILWEKNSSPEGGQNTWLLEFPAQTESTLEMTLHKNKKSINYEHAHCRYSVETIIDGKWKTVAVADIDIVEYIDTNTLETKLKMVLEPKQKYIKKGTLYINLNYEHTPAGKSTQKVATFPRMRNEKNQIFGSLRRSNDDVIAVGASNQPNLSELLTKEVILVVSQLAERPGDFGNLLKKFTQKGKANNQNFQLIYVDFVESNEELTKMVKDEKLEFPVLQGSQELRTSLDQYLAKENVNVLILTAEGDISDNIVGMEAMIKYFQKRMGHNGFTDSVSLSNHSIISRRTTPKDLNSEKLFEKDRIIEVLEEEKEDLKDKNKTLRDNLIDIQAAVEKNAGIQKEHLETEENLEYKTKILQAERDVRATLNKRGVSGITGKKLRTRCFSFESDRICYYDPVGNKIKGQFDVMDIISMEKAPVEKQDKTGVIFLVNTSNRVYEIQAMNDAQMENWISAVNVLKDVVSGRKYRSDSLRATL